MADINKRLLTASDGIPAPQHKVKGESDFEFTEGSSGAQHTKIVDSSGQPISIDEELKSIKRTQAEILDRLDKGIDTRVTGSNVEELYLIESLALTDTSTFNSGAIDVSKYKKISLLGRNTHDADIQLVVTPGQVNAKFWDGSDWLSRTSTRNTLTLPRSLPADLYLFNTFFDELKDIGLMEINVRGKALDVPTTGSINVFIWGVLK